MEGKVALVTEANRGLGLALARAFAELGATVLMVCRSEDAGRKAARALWDDGLDVALHVADVSNPADVEALYAELAETFDCLDVLVNNAGISLGPQDPSIEAMSLDVYERIMNTNLRGTLWMCRTFLPMLRASDDARVINLTSGLGRLSVETDGSHPAYSISKAGVNAVTKLLAEEVQGTDIMVFAVDPGWVKTDMGGPDAPFTIEEGIDTPLWLVTAPAEELHSGSLYCQRAILSW